LSFNTPLNFKSFNSILCFDGTSLTLEPNGFWNRPIFLLCTLSSLKQLYSEQNVVEMVIHFCVSAIYSIGNDGIFF